MFWTFVLQTILYDSKNSDRIRNGRIRDCRSAVNRKKPEKWPINWYELLTWRGADTICKKFERKTLRQIIKKRSVKGKTIGEMKLLERNRK